MPALLSVEEEEQGLCALRLPQKRGPLHVDQGVPVGLEKKFGECPYKTKCYTAFLMTSSALMPASPPAPKASGGAFSGGESKAAKMARYAAFVAAADTEKGLSAAAIPALRTEFGFNELMDNR